jgi:hypothetical protein
MATIEHIKVFDFDETLFRVPGYTCEEAKLLSPYDWFDSPESLDKKFNIRGIKNTLDRTADDCYTMLVTHRVFETKDRVMEILDSKSISFNEVHFLGRGSHKAETVLATVTQVSPKLVTIYEDSLWEIISYTSHFIKADLLATTHIEFYFVDKTKIIKLDWETAKLLQERSTSERLTLL